MSLAIEFTPGGRGRGLNLNSFARRLLAWYARNRRDLPWRRTREPYRIWLSEILLQQTRVEAVIPYYERFLARFPDVQALAAAPLDDVLKAWEGAGYYARARNLHRAAQIIASEYRGRFPRTVAALRELPGIGPYTAGAIASIAFNVDTPVVDGNVERVLARYVALRADPSTRAAQLALWGLAARLVPRGQARDYNQALMELGATICLPRNPRCPECPVRRTCAARRLGLQNELPLRAPKKERPHQTIGVGILIRRGRILIQQRPASGLLGGLWEFPGGKLEPGETLQECVAREFLEEVGLTVRAGPELIAVDHAYSHFSITLHTFLCEYVSGRVRPTAAQQYKWVRPSELQQYAFPAANKKIIAALLHSLSNREPARRRNTR